MQAKRITCEIQLCGLSASNNPTQLPVEFILHDFEFNLNNVRVQKTIAKKALNSLKGMPIVCKYYEVSDVGANDDALGGHEPYLTEDKNGNPLLLTDTIAIGSFIDNAYIATINDNGVEKEVVKGNGILWASRYPDIVSLITRWWEQGLKINSSIELIYDEYSVKEGKEDILNYHYEGHCILNSEAQNGHKVVYPAYNVAKVEFQKLVAEAIKDSKSYTINNTKEACQTGAWSNIDISAIKEQVQNASNATSLAHELCLSLNEGWETSESNMLYPHHVFDGENMVLHASGLETALAKARGQGLSDDSAELQHLRTHYNSLDLEWHSSSSEKNEAKEESQVSKVLKKVFELSFNDTTAYLYELLSAELSNDIYNTCWIEAVYETYFIVSMYDEDNGRYCLKISYSKMENDEITIDYANRVQVRIKHEWVLASEAEQTSEDEKTEASMMRSENSSDSEATNKEASKNVGNEEQLLAEITSLNEKLNSEQEKANNIEQKLNEASDKLMQLVAEVEELRPLRQQIEEVEYEKALNEKTEYYKAKFEALKASEKFESEEVQQMIVSIAKSDDKSKESLLSLNELLIELVKPVENYKQAGIKEFSSKIEKLLPENHSFESRYSE